MNTPEAIVGFVLASGGEGLPNAADFAVALQRNDLEAPARQGRMTLTVRWAGGGAFVDSSPSPYSSLVLDGSGQAVAIYSARVHAMGTGLLELTLEVGERLDASANAPTARLPAVQATPLAKADPGVSDIRCPHCGVVILRKERHRADVERGGAPVYCPRCGERTRVKGTTGTFPLPKPGKR